MFPQIFSQNVSDTEKIIITSAMKELTNENIENSIADIAKKLPDKNIALNLMNNEEIKNWKEYINYDTYEYHTKYDEFENEIYNNIKMDFDGYSNLIYIKSCSWLLDECEKIIKNMVNYQKYDCKKIYNKNLILYEYCALVNNYDEKYEVICNWKENKKHLPYNIIKNILETKGYNMLILEDSINFYLELKLNKKRERDNN